ncbi:Serine/threonine protein kinase [Handroanthus impetiginosus]|uniref:non-specific serine/threonine protein kinase n=1 Tax=Handroanthus impetiginosus TaxID=429701 RepID=A0A2G9GNG8_9LAMI|nr:Serine/threonine protein kinase [Handroanthus impetiginosus]
MSSPQPPEESPASGSGSPPPPSSSSSPPSPDSSSSSPPSPDSSSSSPPSPDSSSSSPPSPDSSSSSPPSPPPPDSSSSGSSSSSPPPPSDDNSQSPPPPPPEDNSSPPPPATDDSPSPPPPPSDSNDDGDSSPPSDSSPPPPRNSGRNRSPPSNGDSPYPPPPPRSSSRGTPPQLTDSSSNNDSSSNETAIIAGAAAGAGLLLLIMIVFMICCARRKKRKVPDDMKYYGDKSQRHMNNYYNNAYVSNGPPSDHIVKMPPPPPGSAGVSSEHSWPVAPPPPPPMMSSSELSSAGFSGPHQAALPPPHPAVALGFNQSTFTYEDLAAATNGFAQSNLLGQGGFGYVHKGVLPNGKEIAVKSLKLNSGQGEREFQAEVDIISRVHHRHLVSLVGYCITGSQRMLVYEFVPNGTLEYHLHGAGCPTMDWPTRLKIALGAAKGFAYLHEDCHPRIIHRDIKAANILIDSNFEAKVADFGLAKLSQDNYTHVSTRIMGTFGYLAPEYASSGKLTEKSDVYSFGIMLLELITGRRPVDINRDDDCLVDWARPILIRFTEGGSYEELVDPRLENNYDPQEMLRMVASAAACIRHSARRRPKMSQIVRALEGDVSLDDLNEGIKAGHNAMLSSSGGSDYDLKRLVKSGATSSQEFTSEDGLTGEFIRSSGGNSQEIRNNLGVRTRSP